MNLALPGAVAFAAGWINPANTNILPVQKTPENM
jgi:hypothetical protein